MSTTRTEDATLVVRPWRATDRDAVLKLLEASLGWRPEDPNAALFSWKHREKPFRRVAGVGRGRRGSGRRVPHLHAVGVRRTVKVVAAVRAVDTATHPAYQGRGIFTRLTLHALEELRRAASTSSSTRRTTRAGRAT